MTGLRRFWNVRPRRDQGGQSLAEFAMVAPIFFLLIFGVIQLGLVMASQNGLVDGVRSAARRAATYRINEASFDATVWGDMSTAGSICGTIADELDARLSDRVIGYSPDRVTPTIAYEWEPNPETGEYFLVAHVSVVYRNPLYVPLIAYFLDGSDGTVDETLTLSASEQMRVENPALDTPVSLSSQPCLP